MIESHDPHQCVKQLRQTLAADKLSIGFFLGAGCPCSIRVPCNHGNGDEPLVPDIGGLTTIVSDCLSSNTNTAGPFKALERTFEEDKFEHPNVEDMLSRIRILRAAAGAESVRGLSGKNLDDLDQEICHTISKRANRALPNHSTGYHAIGRMAGGYRFPPIEIFTSNYDLSVEQALESLQVPFFDGFVGSSRPFFDQRAIEDDKLPDRWARLWKLHGSINWRYNNNTKEISRSTTESDGDELLIHPSHRKYDESRRMPYIVMIDRLKAFLRNGKQPVALIVVGHSFSDEHLNATLIESLKVNPSAACFALQFRKLSDYPIAKKLAEGQPSLTVLARDKAIIRTQQGPWLPQSVAEISDLSGAFKLVDKEGSDETGVGAASNGDDTDDKCHCSFLLGDFRLFGSFLDDITGHGVSIVGAA